MFPCSHVPMSPCSHVRKKRLQRLSGTSMQVAALCAFAHSQCQRGRVVCGGEGLPHLAGLERRRSPGVVAWLRGFVVFLAQEMGVVGMH